MAACDLASRVCRSVVDEDDFEVGIGQRVERGETVLERVRRVVGADDDRHAWPGLSRVGGEGRLVERARDGLGGRLRTSIAIDQPECPVVDLMPPAPPFVGPGVGDGATRAFGECGANVHGRDVGLPGFAFANRVRTSLGQQQRLVPGDVLEPRKIRPEFRLPVQIHVERAHIKDREIEKLGRRKVDVREQPVRRSAFCVFVQVAEESLDADIAVPANDARRYLVAKSREQDGRVPCERAHLAGDFPPDRLDEAAIVEKRDMLRPRQSDHDAQAVLRRFVKQIDSRRRIRTNGVDAQTRHQAKVFGDALAGRELVAARHRARTCRTSRL